MACEVIMKPFHIPKIPATTNKSIRFPNDVIEQVEEAIRGTDCTFSAFVVEATRGFGKPKRAAVLPILTPLRKRPASSFQLAGLLGLDHYRGR